MNASLVSASRLAVMLSLLTGLGLGALPLPALAQYTPPDRGLPGRREGGGTRGGAACMEGGGTLTSFIPPTLFGTTTAAAPKLYWYVPQINAPMLEFVLLDANEDEVYVQEIEGIEGPGIMSVEVPTVVVEGETLSQLQENEDYHWFLSVVCNPNDRSGDIYTEGWVRRIPLDPSLDAQLSGKSATEQSNLYAQFGIWHDAMDAIAQAQCSIPTDSMVARQWDRILTSVGLESFASEPTLFPCEPSE